MSENESNQAGEPEVSPYLDITGLTTPRSSDYGNAEVSKNKKPWLQSYGSIAAEIDADSIHSVSALLQNAMHQFSERTAFHADRNALTYGEVDKLSSSLASYLQKVAGVTKGARVAVMLPNVLSLPVTLIAIAKIGGIQVGINPLYTARELEHQLNDSGSEVIVVFAEAVRTLAQVIERTSVKHVIIVDPDGASAMAYLGMESLPDNWVAMQTAMNLGDTTKFDPVQVSGEDLLFLQYTGGTTGLSKGAALSHRNLIANIQQFRAFMPDVQRPGEEVVVTAIPLYHIFALMVNFLTYFSIGAENWLVANPRNINSCIDVLKAARPTVFTGVNTLYAGLAANPRLSDVDWSRLKLAAGGGAAVMHIVSKRWAAVTGSFIREGYGLSETSPIVSLNPQFIGEFTGNTGLPVPSTEVRLLDDKDNDVRTGESGEICVKGPQVMSGYWKNTEANNKAFTADGYFRTGDVGVFDEKGFLRIVDRKKDMVLVSGFNVYPNEVEASAATFPGIAECACVGVPDAQTGEAVKLYVIKLAGAEVDAEALTKHCRENLAAYKVPKIISFVDALPKSTVGKILRRELRGTD